MHIKILLCLLTVTSAINLDIFKWPTFAAHSRNRNYGGFQERGFMKPIHNLARMRNNAFRKLGKGINNMKTKFVGIMKGNQQGSQRYQQAYPPPSRPSYYGENTADNGYFEIVQGPSLSVLHHQSSSTFPKPSNPDLKSNFRVISIDSEPSYSDADAPVSNFSPPEESKSSYQDVANAPLSAAMNMGKLLEEDIVGKDNGQWKPVIGPTRPTSIVAARVNKLNPVKVQKAELLISSVINGSFLPKETPHNGVQLTPPIHSFVPSVGELKIQENTGLPTPILPNYPPISDVISNPEVISNAKSFNNHQELLGNSDNFTTFEAADLARGKTLTRNPFPQEDVNFISEDFSFSSPPSDLILVPGRESNLVFGSLLENLRLHIFVKLLRRANLESMLTAEGGFTIFVPTDSAFSLQRRHFQSQLENDSEFLRQVLLHHIMPGKLSLIDARNEMLISSAAPVDQKLRINIYDFGSDLQPIVTLNGARLKQPDMLSTNGIVHLVDRVLYPTAKLSIIEHLRSCDIFKGANVAITSSGLTEILDKDGPFTFFVPSTDAFALIDNSTVDNFISNLTLLQDVMLYHVVPGTFYSEGVRDGMWLPTLSDDMELQVKVTSDGYLKRMSGVGLSANIIRADIVAKNGVIHIIDRVLQPGMETMCDYF